LCYFFVLSLQQKWWFAWTRSHPCEWGAAAAVATLVLRF
jgi:hypothetical protein